MVLIITANYGKCSECTFSLQ